MRAEERRYKTIGSYLKNHSVWKTQDFSCDVWKDLKLKARRGDKNVVYRYMENLDSIHSFVIYHDGADVVWMNFRTLSIPNFPGLVSNEYSSSQPSYFIDDKRLVMCSCDETGHPWIYILKENKLISKVKLNSVVDPWPVHCTYFPSLVPVPGSPIEEALLQV
ncbi:unnamed protein product [Brassica rapa]|uniref:F-box associated beta-propeller type 1 domain-containing protein n=2 Tax=Brassica TaxID=3705 RepID=A0A3P5YXA7_BRACM|nr:unnamed protein product [Brassica napus]CAG7877383.1 unnamed protein product [Brassica rapa]VDC72407.1 unnamed protein product [Brassica rapa]